VRIETGGKPRSAAATGYFPGTEGSAHMYPEEYEDPIQINAEELAEELFGSNYNDLSPELQGWICVCIVESHVPEYAQQDSIGAA